jgi:hypothetical protein
MKSSTGRPAIASPPMGIIPPAQSETIPGDSRVELIRRAAVMRQLDSLLKHVASLTEEQQLEHSLSLAHRNPALLPLANHLLAKLRHSTSPLRAGRRPPKRSGQPLRPRSAPR